MNVKGRHYQGIWDEDGKVKIIDQRPLPHKLVIEELKTVDEVAAAIKDMHVRGAPLIGVTAAYGMYIAAKQGVDLKEAAKKLLATRPTAVDLKWALEEQNKHTAPAELLQNARKITNNYKNLHYRITNKGGYFHFVFVIYF